MLVIRLFRRGKRNQPFFKIIVTDKRNAPKGGRFIEEVGFWNPLTKENNLKTERIKYWLSKGAKPSSAVHNLLIKKGIIEGKKIPVHKKSKKKEAVAGSKPEIESKKTDVSSVEKPVEKPVEQIKPDEAKKLEEPKKSEEQEKLVPPPVKETESAPIKSEKPNEKEDLGKLVEEKKESVPEIRKEEKKEDGEVVA